ncbi:hypothetical protein AB7W88_19965 [Providencia vermicola]|jgi:hypothetical protein|uniref:Uncharacterized protein n=4 Tax=Morganellaceae TaxID=1903414 RepID=A0A899NIA8_PROST|nr:MULTISPECIES: hypothetical protein [Enterobacterales]URQ57379.1 Hypothetical protein [Providencia alcalifaciens]ELB1111595.1 hypothetical protein [Morganella morganii]ELL8908945.1 hypothetical protein [Proteus mirabilis]ELQ1458648.1 hypothetical protein [Providencia rettgeri]ELR5098731.1 hypothetical protein [Providencia rettgeri]
MINRTFLRWFLTILLVLLFYLGLAVFDFGFSSSFTYNYMVMGDNEPITVWRAFVEDLRAYHQNTLAYVYLGTPVLLALLFVIHKKIR